MKTNIDLLMGPYVGNWEHEIITFRPYVKWLQSVIGKNNNVYISSHINRRFLYDWIDDDMFIPIYESLSRDEQQQYKNIHNTLNAKDFSILVKNIKNTLVSKQPKKTKIKMYTFNYTVNAIVNCPIHNKAFSTIQVNNNKEDYIVFIPDKNETEERLNNIYTHLINTYDNIVVIGDMNTYLHDKNIILDCVDYFENGYIYITEYITNAKFVVCPASYWTAIANIQHVPVFSWGDVSGPYNKDGIYNFGNDCMSITTDKNTPINIITSMIDYFIK